MSQIHLETLDAILEKHQCDPSQVIAIMQDIQKEYHYLPESALCYTARKLGISDAKIYGVATFYENPFSVVVLGKFRRFLLVIFLSLFLHLDFSFIYSKFSMPFWGFFY